MSDNLKAVARERVGKGAARATRREGLVPAVIYGDNKAPLTIALPYKETEIAASRTSFTSTVIDLDVDGKTHKVIAKDVQRDVVRGFPMHIDFLRVAKGATLTLEIPVAFINEEAAPGLKQGGVLNVVRYAIELNVPADAVPESVEVDLTGLEMGEGVHISAVTLPEGVTPTIDDRDFTIATVAAPAAVASAANEAGDAEGAEGGEEAAEAEGGDE